MQTQHIVRGVLVRPLETLSTNFLSTRYYDGKQIVDLLESEDGVSAWLEVMESGLGAVGGFSVTNDDLPMLRTLRDALEGLYAATVAEEDVQPHISALLAGLKVNPRVHAEADIPSIWWSSDAPSLENLECSIILSSCMTVTGPRRARIRKCHAPKCVLYFTKGHAKQSWCSSVCGNRARVARHANRIPEK